MSFFPRSRKNGRRRRRDDDGVRAVAFELGSLEFVQASDEIGLLRVGGLWTAPASLALGDIVLSVDRDGEVVELAPLPDLNGLPVASPSGESWRGAFTVAVDLIDDPRAKLELVAGSDARVALPRPSEWAEMQERAAAEEAAAEAAAAAEAESPVVADLVAKLEEVAQLDDGEDEDAGPAMELELADELEDVEPVEDPELALLRSEVELLRAHLQEARAELEAERGRREAIEEEMRSRLSVEDDLRNAMAMQEAEMASAVADASQRVRQAERRRDIVAAPGRTDHPEHPRVQPAGEDFLTRLERARRASETVG